MTRHPFLSPPALTVALLSLVLTACGAEAADVDPPAAAVDPAAACEPGPGVCNDTPSAPTGTGGVQSGPDGSVPIAEAVAAGIDGPFLVSGYYLADAAGQRFCESLAESFPPQCGGTSVDFDAGGADPAFDTTTEGDVSWSESPVTVEGELVGDTFVVGAP